jgi:hypothetical protein
MTMKSMTIVVAACAVVTSALLAGCGPTDAATAGGPTAGPAQAPAPGLSALPTPAVKDIPPGNCSVYPKANAVTLLGGVNANNEALDIGTDGGTKIDLCSYLYLKGTQDLQGVSYAVVRYDSGATAFAEAQKVQTTMLGSAADNNWPVQSLTTPAPGAGPVLGGYGTKTDEDIPYTMAIVGTNVGPYLVVALGASTESADNAKNFALQLFQALSAAVG